MTLFSSEKFKLNSSDLLRGAVVAVLTAVLKFVYNIIELGSWPTGDQLKNAALVGVAALLAYLIKNFFSAPAIPPDGTPTESQVKAYGK